MATHHAASQTSQGDATHAHLRFRAGAGTPRQFDSPGLAPTNHTRKIASTDPADVQTPTKPGSTTASVRTLGAAQSCGPSPSGGDGRARASCARARRGAGRAVGGGGGGDGDGGGGPPRLSLPGRARVQTPGLNWGPAPGAAMLSPFWARLEERERSDTDVTLVLFPFLCSSYNLPFSPTRSLVLALVELLYELRGLRLLLSKERTLFLWLIMGTAAQTFVINNKVNISACTSTIRMLPVPRFTSRLGT